MSRTLATIYGYLVFLISVLFGATLFSKPLADLPASIDQNQAVKSLAMSVGVRDIIFGLLLAMGMAKHAYTTLVYLFIFRGVSDAADTIIGIMASPGAPATSYLKLILPLLSFLAAYYFSRLAKESTK